VREAVWLVRLFGGLFGASRGGLVDWLFGDFKQRLLLVVVRALVTSLLARAAQ
jgi:hypothetical protein